MGRRYVGELRGIVELHRQRLGVSLACRRSAVPTRRAQLSRTSVRIAALGVECRCDLRLKPVLNGADTPAANSHLAAETVTRSTISQICATDSANTPSRPGLRWSPRGPASCSAPRCPRPG